MVQLSSNPNMSSLYEGIIHKYIKFKKVNNLLLEICYLKGSRFYVCISRIFSIFLNCGDDVCLPLVWTGSRQVAY